MSAALTMRSFRQVRCGSSVGTGLEGLMMVEVEEVVRSEGGEWEYPEREEALVEVEALLFHCD